MTNRYKLTFEYDGTDFKGWQKQPEGRTVQGVIEKSFSTLFQEEIRIAGQGRTDAGVHAKAQVAHADLPTVYTTHRLYRAMRGLLPRDIVLLSAEKMNDTFHARFDATSRVYQYKIIERPAALMRNYSWSVFKPVSFDLLEECAEMIAGEHDFINFCIPPDEPEMTTNCSILKSQWQKTDKDMAYFIEGNRFLRHLVRRLVGAMVQVADGTIQLSEFQRLLSGEKTHRKAHAAPAKGLTLLGVKYN